MSKAVMNGSIWCHICRSKQRPLRASCNPLPMTKFILQKYSNLNQAVEMNSEASSQENDNTESAVDCCSEIGGSTNKLACDSKADVDSDFAAVSHNVMSKLKVSARHDLALVFTCKVCETRSMKMCSRDSYEKGVVVVRCGGCDNLHLIADRLGWFGEPGSIEDLLAARGDVLKKGSIDSLNFTLEDLVGKKL
ncbi:DNL-type zinc finger protein [Bienertia sinuspersici]